MVKTILSLLISAGLLAAAAIGEYIFVDRQFETFGASLAALDTKRLAAS